MLEKLLAGWRGVWLLPFIHAVRGREGFRVGELAAELGVRSTLIKTVIHSLKRYGLVVRRGEGVYALRDGVAEEYEKLFKTVVVRGNHYLAYTGSHYIYARLSRSRVSAWVLPEYIVRRVEKAARENPGLRPSELGRLLGLHGRTVSRALLVLRLLGGEERVEDKSGLGDRT